MRIIKIIKQDAWSQEMKKNKPTYFILLIILFFYSCSDNRSGVTFYYKYYPDGKIKTSVEIHTYDSIQISREYNENSILKEELFGINKKLFLSKTYYKSGKIFRISSYHNGGPVGNTLFFYENGKTKEFHAYNLNHQLIYMSKYTANGKKIMSKVLPFVEAKDSIKIGEPYTLKISFAYKLKGKAELIIGKFDHKSGIIDEIASIPLINNSFTYQFYPKQRGKYVMDEGMFFHESAKGDSLDIDRLTLYKHEYIVW